MQCTNSTHNLGAAHRQTTRTPHAQGFSFSHTGSRYANALTRDGRGRIHAPSPYPLHPPFPNFPVHHPPRTEEGGAHHTTLWNLTSMN